MSDKPSNHIDLNEKIAAVMNGDRRNALLIVLFFIACSMVPVGYGSYKLHHFWDISTHGVESKAEVVRIEEVRSSSSSHSNYYPVIRFKDAAENIHVQKVERVKRFQYEEGDTVDILYDPDKPSRVVINDFKDHIVAAVIVLMIGLAALWFVVVTALHYRKQ